MTSLATSCDDNNVANPLDLVEQVIAANDWIFDRRSDSDMAAEAPGKWCDYGLYFCWSDEIAVMHFSCAFDLKAPEKRGMDEETGMPIYRHSVLLRGAQSASAEAIEDLVDIALTECERFFPAFQFVLWGGKSPDDALEAAMLECVGEA